MTTLPRRRLCPKLLVLFICFQFLDHYLKSQTTGLTRACMHEKHGGGEELARKQVGQTAVHITAIPKAVFTNYVDYGNPSTTYMNQRAYTNVCAVFASQFNKFEKSFSQFNGVLQLAQCPEQVLETFADTHYTGAAGPEAPDIGYYEQRTNLKLAKDAVLKLAHTVSGIKRSGDWVVCRSIRYVALYLWRGTSKERSLSSRSLPR
ncbi:hypothetical protein K503DRAFT_779252 [Rhizopogon vinicolor AM-OR11-026]|uniref:Uncharacterized protein n=1 Tax=Rhizopogon vinicolor AM-OR11-026 TaxID=1314800 RepID=A0A1B7NEM2_9AGAM|nr:hypothetical protein K503DRAFT_779252 [Rhizopogon vinicolor AM-OR11-026]